MNEKNISDDELEDEIDKPLKINEKKRYIFSIIRKEKESLELKERRIKDKFKY